MKTTPYGPFLGINNRLPDSAMRTEKGDFLRAADNVEIDNANRLRRRNGRTLVQAMTAPHSWFETDETNGYLVRDSALYSVDLTSGYSETFLKTLTSNSAMSYHEFNGDLYFSNGTDSGRVNAGTVYPWGLASPAQPTLSTVSGTLSAGKYQVALTYSNSASGEEGGAAGVKSHTLAANNSGIRIPLPGASYGATHVNVYVSEVNGSLPYLHTSVAIGQATIDIGSVGTGRALRTNFQEPMPAGTGLFMHMGRLCAKKGKFLYYGLPYRPGYYDPVAGYIPFEENISVAMSCENGVYVVADKARWIPGDIDAPEGRIIDVLPYGAVPDSHFTLPNDVRVGWFGENGIVIADNQGGVKSVMDDNIDVDMPISGASNVFADRGYLRVYSCGYCLNVENMAVTTYSNYAFTSLSGGHGTMADGFYALTGKKDGTVAIPASIEFGNNNFGAEELKRLPYAYIGGTSEAPMQLRIKWADQRNVMQDFTYEAKSSGGNLSMHRFELGRGIESSWFDISLFNKLGADFNIASISFDPKISTRRI